MAKTEKRKLYSKEFKIKAIRLLERSGRSQLEIARELGVGASSMSRWKAKYGAEEAEASSDGESVKAKDERIRQLKRENEILRQERDILKKALAIFSHPSK